MGSTRDIYQICHPYKIKRTAVDLSNKILARSHILEDVVEQIHITAVTQCNYTRSVALLVKAVFDNLNRKNSALAETFVKEVVDSGTSTYVEFWLRRVDEENVPESRLRPFSVVNPDAVSFFISDLTSLGFISYQRIDHILSHFVSATAAYDHLFQRFHRSNMSQIYFRPEEKRLLNLLVAQIRDSSNENAQSGYWADNLNVEEALMASVCIDPMEIYQPRVTLTVY